MQSTNSSAHLSPVFSRRLADWFTPAGLTAFFGMAVAVSMLFSPFVLSVAMWGLVFTALWQSARGWKAAGGNVEWPLYRKAMSVLAYSFRVWWNNKIMVGLSALFLLVLLSGFWSENTVYWLERTRVRIPFFVLAWAFANLPDLSAAERRFPLYGLVLAAVLFCIGVGINLYLHFPEIMEGLKKGQPIPVPRSHIRFSLLVVTAVLCAGWLWTAIRATGPGWLRWSLLACTVFLFVFLHVLSVRSGLAALYAALVFGIFRFLCTPQRWKLGVAALLILLSVPVVALKTIPSLAQRISYMQHDWNSYLNQKGADYSDSERWVSLHAGWIIFREHPLLGVGAGDLPAEIERVVRTQFPAYKRSPKLPHNQFLYIMAGTGLLGLLISLWALGMPFRDPKARKYPLFWLFQVVVFVSFLVEYTLETSIGAAFYLFFTLWFQRYAPDESAQACRK